MDSDQTWKWVERCTLVVGAVCAIVTAAYTIGLFYGWDKHEAAKAGPIAAPDGVAMSAQWPLIALGILAAVALLTAWVMIFIRLRAQKSQTTQEFIPRGSLISLNEIEFNVGRLSQAAPWLELYLRAPRKIAAFLNLCESNCRNRIRGCGYDGSIRFF
jgi:hypothetical protein